ncbi:MAG: chemotaxis response regulator protein-glutamate methylesterase [Thermodesulfobacteriota bacterium]|nr:chemotaxis response regulator protein-glutamate methylesterase [Thermodesulfobacteriota bacterium]
MIKVLIVDDSAVVRKVLSKELSKFNDIDIVGTAVDPYVARDKIVKIKPDVLTLDLEMPRMDGLTFLAKLMRFHPMPVVVLSSLTPKNSETALKALDLGAVEVLCKPGDAYSTLDISQSLAGAIRTAASARINYNPKKSDEPVKVALSSALLSKTTHKIIAIGASTGGTKAIEVVLRGMPAISPGTVIVQHMPEHFTTSFAHRLNEISQMEVREARDNDHVIPGVALIAPGNYHMVLRRNGATYTVKIKDGPRVHYQRPAVDVLFRSVAKTAGSNAVGTLLTGMGMDGAKGLLEMKEHGAYTMAQDEATSIVFGMPKEAIKMGAADKVVPLQNVSQAIIDALQGVAGQG